MTFIKATIQLTFLMDLTTPSSFFKTYWKVMTKKFNINSDILLERNGGDAEDT